MIKDAEAASAASPPPITLVSASPRRRRLLGWLGLPFAVQAVETPEDLTGVHSDDPERLAEHLASEKALAARELGLVPTGLTLTFDTIVVLDGDVLGKPVDVDDAWRMLRALSGREHEVVTGVALLCADHAHPRAFSVTTTVMMRELDDDAIRAWMAKGEFMGCAGAYNIERQVADVGPTECYQNVAGLPLCHLYAMLRGGEVACRFGEPTSPVARCDAELGRTCQLGRLLAAG